MEITADHKHVFRESTIKDYEVCIECGTYHSTAQVEPSLIYETDYWDTGDSATGRSTIEQQSQNFECIDDCGISKSNRIMQFVPDGGKVALEIACAPGNILKRLIEKGYEAWGIEPNSKYLEFICNKAPNSKVIHGYFPQVFNQGEHDLYDCIVALDVMEHTDDFKGFFMAVNRLLKDGGTAVAMSPIILTDGLYRKIDFNHPDEHCYIHSQAYLEPYLNSIFGEVKFQRWIVGHEIITMKKKSIYYQEGERYDFELCSDYGLKNDK